MNRPDANRRYELLLLLSLALLTTLLAAAFAHAGLGVQIVA